jgi:hemoglobin
MTVEVPSLFIQIGGLKGLQTVVKKFYRYAFSDDLVGHFFEDMDMEAMIDHQILFLRYALGDQIEYSGRALDAVHRNLNISNEDFNRIGELLQRLFKMHRLMPMQWLMLWLLLNLKGRTL